MKFFSTASIVSILFVAAASAEYVHESDIIARDLPVAGDEVVRRDADGFLYAVCHLGFAFMLWTALLTIILSATGCWNLPPNWCLPCRTQAVHILWLQGPWWLPLRLLIVLAIIGTSTSFIKVFHLQWLTYSFSHTKHFIIIIFI